LDDDPVEEVVVALAVWLAGFDGFCAFEIEALIRKLDEGSGESLQVVPWCEDGSLAVLGWGVEGRTVLYDSRCVKLATRSEY
jgi:hypothetical protein